MILASDVKKASYVIGCLPAQVTVTTKYTKVA